MADLPREAWILIWGGFVNRLGNGLIFPFAFIYLHSILGLGYREAGFVLSAVGIGGLLATPVGGVLVDKFGERIPLNASLLLLTLGYGGFSLVQSSGQAYVAAAIAGIGNGIFWPSQLSLLTRVVSNEQRHVAFAMDGAGANLGIGLGGAIGGFLVGGLGSAGYRLLFGLDALTFVVFLILLASISRPALIRAKADPVAGRATANPNSRGYLALLRDRALRGLLVIRFLFVLAAYAQLEALPLYAKSILGMPASILGLVFLVNTMATVALELPVAHLVSGRRRMRALLVGALVWGTAWLMVAVSGLATTVSLGVIILCLVGIVFAIGEAIETATYEPLIASLAPTHLLGRYLTASSVSWQVGLVAGPAATGLVMSFEPLALWPSAAAVLIVAGLLGLLFERRIPAEARLTGMGREVSVP